MFSLVLEGGLNTRVLNTKPSVNTHTPLEEYPKKCLKTLLEVS
jgi:hypothetical protein